jgi:hypothetical protein
MWKKAERKVHWSSYIDINLLIRFA